MDIKDIKVGHVYGNGKGMYRKVCRFTDHKGKPCDEPYNIWYLRCSENGAVKNAKERVCWRTTFAEWVKEYKGYVGNLKPELNQ